MDMTTASILLSKLHSGERLVIYTSPNGVQVMAT